MLIGHVGGGETELRKPQIFTFTTPSIDLVTFLVVTADCTRLAVASTRADIRRKFNDWFFCLEYSKITA